MVQIIALTAALVGAASAGVVIPAGLNVAPYGINGAYAAGAPFALNGYAGAAPVAAINGYAGIAPVAGLNGYAYGAAPAAYAAGPAYGAAPIAYGAAPAYAQAALPAIQPVNYALPPVRTVAEAPIVEQTVEKVEQHGYSVRY